MDILQGKLSFNVNTTTSTVEKVEHQGIVEAVDVRRSIVTVRLDVPRECGGCPAARLCASATGEDAETMEIPSRIAGAYRPGDRVVVTGTEAMHRKAIMLATVLPSVILISFMVGVYLLTFSQLAACLSGLGAMVAFFIVLWLCRNRIRREFVFTIRNQRC